MGNGKIAMIAGAVCVLASGGVALASGGVALAGSAAASTATATTSTATASTTTTPASAGVTSQIVLDNGGYQYCLDDYGEGKTAGTKVVLWKCNKNDPAQQWVFYSNYTIRPKVATGKVLGVGRNGHTVLQAAGTAKTAWSYHANGAMREKSPTGAPNVKEPGLNDPAFKVGDGVQLLSYRQVHTASNAHWWVKGAIYSTTRVVNRPDRGIKGGYWALETGTYLESLVYTGKNANGAYTYEDAQHILAHFTTMPGSPQPHGASASDRVGDVLKGGMWGWSTSTLTSTARPSSRPPARVTGMTASTELSPRVFFSSGAQVTLKKKSGYFLYTSKTDNCGNVERLTKTDDDGTANNSVGWVGYGNIPAYAATSADNLAGGQYCGESGT